MPNERRLAYRDRYVWELAQEMTGESGLLSPLSFEPDVETTFAVSFTEQQITRLLSALMTGADLSYPTESHQTVWDFLKFVEYPMSIENYAPGNIDLWTRYATVSAGALTTFLTALQPFGYFMQTDATANRSMISRAYFPAGNYNYTGLYAKTNDAGIHDLALFNDAGTHVYQITTNIDQYGATSANFALTATFNVANAGYHTLRVRNQGYKNVLSSGYKINWTSHHVERTS
jgi:hypothetical protein